jgi:hypothetical protein
MLHLDLEDFLVSNCFDYFQLQRSQANILSRQGHDGYIKNNSQE